MSNNCGKKTCQNYFTVTQTQSKTYSNAMVMNFMLSILCSKWFNVWMCVKLLIKHDIPAILLSFCSFCGLGSFADDCGVSDFIDSVVSMGSFFSKKIKIKTIIRNCSFLCPKKVILFIKIETYFDWIIVVNVSVIVIWTIWIAVCAHFYFE